MIVSVGIFLFVTEVNIAMDLLVTTLNHVNITQKNVSYEKFVFISNQIVWNQFNMDTQKKFTNFKKKVLVNLGKQTSNEKCIFRKTVLFFSLYGQKL